MFGLSILAAFGMDHISRLLSYRFSQLPFLPYTVQILGCMLVLFEFMAVLPAQAVVKTPLFYTSIRDSLDSSPILEVPINLLGGSNRDSSLDAKLMEHYYEHQKIHQKPIFGGYWSRVAEKYENFLRADPVLHYVYDHKTDIFGYRPTSPLVHLKKTYGVNHVILHKSFMSNSDVKLMTGYFGDQYIEDNSVKDNNLIIYSTNITTPTPIDLQDSNTYAYITLGNGWHELELWKNKDGEDIPSRWMSDHGELIIHSKKAHNASLKYTAYKYKKDRIIDISITNSKGTQKLNSTIITDGFHIYTTPVNLSKGKNIISLTSLNGADKPCDDTTATSNDNRALSIGLQNVVIIQMDTH